MREFEGMANEGLIRTICGTDVTEVKDMSLRTLRRYAVLHYLRRP